MADFELDVTDTYPGYFFEKNLSQIFGIYGMDETLWELAWPPKMILVAKIAGKVFGVAFVRMGINTQNQKRFTALDFLGIADPAMKNAIELLFSGATRWAKKLKARYVIIDIPAQNAESAAYLEAKGFAVVYASREYKRYGLSLDKESRPWISGG